MSSDANGPFDAIVVGAGPAGTFAAQALAGRRVLVLDVGREPGGGGDELRRNVYAAKAAGADLFAGLIGRRFESLHNVAGTYLSPKLKAPLVRYVTEGWQRLSPVIASGFDPVMSFARGGLANAWGAGCYRFDDGELADFPIRARDLDPHYDALTGHIGITGEDDDLGRFFGSSAGCLPSHRQSRIGADLQRGYERHRAHFHRRGIFVGAPRLAVLSREHRGRPVYDYQGLEFFKPHLPAIYNPAFTLTELVAAGEIDYRRPFLVERFVERERDVLVHARHVESGARHEFTARNVVLAAGALNTAKLVLRSRDDCASRLPLLDNLISYVPFVSLRHIGAGVEHESLPIQRNIVVVDADERAPVQASFYGVTATLWNDLLFDFPFAARDNMRMLKFLLPAMSVVQFFYADRARPENSVRLGADGALHVDYVGRPRGSVERKLIAAFRRIGYFGAASLCKYPLPGNSFHYAGCLPMSTAPGPLQTDRDGRLGGSRRVRVADAACFSSLPSKNLTFTIMANAHRIGTAVARELTA